MPGVVHAEQGGILIEQLAREQVAQRVQLVLDAQAQPPASGEEVLTRIGAQEFGQRVELLRVGGVQRQRVQPGLRGALRPLGQRQVGGDQHGAARLEGRSDLSGG